MLTAQARAEIAENPHMREKLARKARILDPRRNTTRPAAERIADDMIDIAGANGGACLDTDLYLRGWSPQALAAHGTAARRIAIAAAEGAR